MSKVIKPFNVELAKKGASIELQNGNPVRIICYDAVGSYPLVGLIKSSDDCEITDRFAIDDNRLRIVEETKEPWRMSEEAMVDGFYVLPFQRLILSGACITNTTIREVKNVKYEKQNRIIFAKKQQAQASIAAAQISQIIANDERFGGEVTDKEWKRTGVITYSIIYKYNGEIVIFEDAGFRTLLSFHTYEQADLFLKEYRDIVEQYFMIEKEE